MARKPEHTYASDLSFEIGIRGLDEIARRLQLLPEKLRRKSIRKALNDGAEIIRAEAERNVSKIVRKRPIKDDFLLFLRGPDIRGKGGRLRDNVITTVKVGSKEGRAGMEDIDAYARVGLNYKKVHHGHLVEFGTKPHWIKIKLRDRTIRLHHPGSAAQPFMRPAFDNKGNESVDTMITQLAQAVEKEF